MNNCISPKLVKLFPSVVKVNEFILNVWLCTLEVHLIKNERQPLKQVVVEIRIMCTWMLYDCMHGQLKNRDDDFVSTVGLFRGSKSL